MASTPSPPLVTSEGDEPLKHGSSNPLSQQKEQPPQQGAAAEAISSWQKLDGSPADTWMATLLGALSTKADEASNAAAGLDTRPWNIESLGEAGVPADSCAGVLEVAMRLGARRGGLATHPPQSNKQSLIRYPMRYALHCPPSSPLLRACTGLLIA